MEKFKYFVLFLKNLTNSNFPLNKSLSFDVPIVGNIPVIGWLFKSKGIENKSMDLYIKLKVDIIKKKNTEKVEMTESKVENNIFLKVKK